MSAKQPSDDDEQHQKLPPVFKVFSPDELVQRLPSHLQQAFQDDKSVPTLNVGIEIVARLLTTLQYLPERDPKEKQYLYQYDYVRLALEKVCRETSECARLKFPNPAATLQRVWRWARDSLRDYNRLIPKELSELIPVKASESSKDGGSRSSFPCYTTKSTVFTSIQARAILANAFLGNCIDVVARSKDPRHEGGLNFLRMLMAVPSSSTAAEKFKCLLVYFEAVAHLEHHDCDREIIFDLIRFEPLTTKANGYDAVPTSIFEAGQEIDDTNTTATNFVGNNVVIHDGSMESPSRKCLGFVNFANANYGYGKFQTGCTQEEILLMCCPEACLGMLFIGKMRDNEIVNVRNIRRFVTYSGYLDTFVCQGPFSFASEGDHDSEIQSICTMDACYKDHFSSQMIDRDVSKAYYAFRALSSYYQPETSAATSSDAEKLSSPAVVISTGKWGCGMFRGPTSQKFLQQVVAAQMAGVGLDFSCFDGRDEGCREICDALAYARPTAKEVLQILHACTVRKTFVSDVVAALKNDGKSAPGLLQQFWNTL